MSRSAAADCVERRVRGPKIRHVETGWNLAESEAFIETA